MIAPNGLIKIVLPAFLLGFLQAISFLVVTKQLENVNPKIFFGLLLSNNSAFFISFGITLVIFFLLIQKKIQFIFGSMVLVGAISNILERCLYGGVVDYLSFGNWFVFNLSDILIVLGSIGVSTHIILKNTLSISDR